MSRYATPRDLIPEAHCVLGTMLRPFSLGHHLLFARTSSPFEGNEAVVAPPEDLALAVFICAAPYSQTQEAILRGDWESEHRLWTQKLKPRFWQRTPFKHEVEMQKFTAYLKDGYRRAPVQRHQLANGVEFTSPWECLMLARLMQGGFSERTALELYMPAAWYHYHTISEIRQADNITNVASWRKTFWTEKDALAYAAAAAPRPEPVPITIKN